MTSASPARSSRPTSSASRSARVLRVQAHDLRNKRQMAAEQKAMKAPIKMLFPTVLFIFPAMFIVILGPAMMTLLQTFSSGGAAG